MLVHQLLSTLVIAVSWPWLSAPILDVNSFYGDWNCKPVKWSREPAIENELFVGTAEADCTFESRFDIRDTASHLVDLIQREATAVHSGPTPTTFEGIPSTFIDMTVEAQREGMSVRVRADTNIASDGQIKVILDSKSKSIEGSGSEYLRKSDGRLVITKGTASNGYSATLGADVKIARPPMVPLRMFKRRVRSGMEAELRRQESEIFGKLTNRF